MTHLSEFDTGLVLYKTRSPYASFVSAVTKQPFSNAGVFYKTSIYGYPTHVVVGMDLFGLQRPTLKGPSMTLEKLQRDPNIERLAIRPLKKILNEDGTVDESRSQKLENVFRAKMATIHASPASPEATVADIFGMKYDRTQNEKTPMQLINDIIMDLSKQFCVTSGSDGGGAGSDMPNLESWRDLNNSSPVPDDETGRLQLAALFGTPFFRLSETPGMGSAITERQIFGDIEMLELTPHDELVIKKHIMDATSAEAAFMRKFSEAFVTMLFKDRTFLSSVIEGVNMGRELLNKGRIVEENLVDTVMSSGGDLIRTLNHSIDTGRISYSELRDAVNKHLSSLEFLGSIRGVNPNLPTLRELDRNTPLIIEVNVEAETVKTDLKSVMTDLEQCTADIRSNKTPKINISQIYTLLNKLTGSQLSIDSGSRIDSSSRISGGESGSYGAILVSNPSGTPVNLNQTLMFIYPTTTVEDLKSLSQQELREIDKYLYSLPNASLYETVRARIASLLK